jgi:hypothetical protein
MGEVRVPLLESSSALVYTMWSYLRESEWTSSFPPSSMSLVGKSLWGTTFRFMSPGSWVSHIFSLLHGGRKSYVHFRFFGRSFEIEFSHFSEIMFFSSSCMLEEKAWKIFSRVKFCDEIFGKSTRIRFSDIHNPTMRFIHRWIAFTLFPTQELRPVMIAEFRCLYAMVRKIRYSPVVDTVNNFGYLHLDRTHWVHLYSHPDYSKYWVLGDGTHVLHWGGHTSLGSWPFCVCTHIEWRVRLFYFYVVWGIPNPTIALYSYKQLT